MHKLLVVDDDLDLLEMLKLFFRRKNFEVNAIAQWENIKTAITTFNPDLILLDISLQGADGRVICKQLKMDKDTQDIPILLFSANYGVKHTIPQYFADGFIEKPFDPAHLVTTINSILSGYKKVES